MWRISAAVITAGFFVLLLGAAERSSSNDPDSIARALEGVWVYVGEPGDIKPPPKAGERLKFRMNNRWTFTVADPTTGTVRHHFGGTYRVNGNEYLETVDYSSDPDDPELKSTLRFTVKFEGDTMMQTGIGNPYTEVWKRVR